MLSNKLKKIGILEEKESSTYLAILELGETTIQRISKKTKIKRTTLYDVIESLRNKGLVGLTKSGKKNLYYAEDPRKIEENLENKKQEYLKILPEILSITNLIDKKPKIRFFEGIDGIKEVYRDTLKYPKSETLAWLSLDAVNYFDIEYLWKDYVKKRVEKKIWQRSIAPNNEYLKKVKTFDQKHLRQTKLIDQKLFPLEVEINLYGKNNIGIMAFKEQIGLIIESEKIYNTLKSIFEMNWKMLEQK